LYELNVQAFTIIESFATTGESPNAVLAIGLPDGVCDFPVFVFDVLEVSTSPFVFESGGVSVVFLIFGIFGIVNWAIDAPVKNDSEAHINNVCLKYRMSLLLIVWVSEFCRGEHCMLLARRNLSAAAIDPSSQKTKCAAKNGHLAVGERKMS
jgi:hypothetical protein